MTRLPQRRGLSACRQDCSGSLLLESSLVLPWIAVAVFVLMLFALFLSQGVTQYYKASITAERAAFNWSNSARDPRTGAVPAGRYDGLYWRLTEDTLLDGLLGLGFGGDRETTSVPLGTAADPEEGTAPANKLAQAGAGLAERYSGELRFANRAVDRTVSAELRGHWLPDGLEAVRGGNGSAAIVSAPVSDPVELLRSVDLIRYYMAKMRKAPGGAESYRTQAKAALVIRTGK